MSFLPSDILGRIADVFSIAGFCITVYVAWIARNIRREAQRRAVLPQMLDDLETLAEKLTVHLRPPSDHGERAELIGRTEGKLNALRDFSDEKERESIAIVSRRVTICRGQNPRQEDLVEMQSDLYRLIEELRGQVQRG